LAHGGKNITKLGVDLAKDALTTSFKRLDIGKRHNSRALGGVYHDVPGAKLVESKLLSFAGVEFIHQWHKSLVNGLVKPQAVVGGVVKTGTLPPAQLAEVVHTGIDGGLAAQPQQLHKHRV
jgi:hypothetical protein